MLSNQTQINSFDQSMLISKAIRIVEMFIKIRFKLMKNNFAVSINSYRYE